MKLVAITQRVTVEPRYQERRDCLDQSWARFMARAGLLAAPVPNHPETAIRFCEAAGITGVVLTGGDDLATYGGSAPERDITEFLLLEFAVQRRLPVLGVCRGMQVIQHWFGIPLHPVVDHVKPRQRILIDGCPAEVNSYHRLAAHETRPPLQVWAVAEDGAIEAVRHTNGAVTGIMWHPERMAPISESDIALFGRTFGVMT